MLVKMLGVKRFQEQLIIFGLMLYVLCEEKPCDPDTKQGSAAFPDYSENVCTANFTICCEYTQIRCGEDYAPSLLDKSPTCYLEPPKQCQFVTILFFGKYDETNSTALLWFVENIPTCKLKTGFTKHSGKEIVCYNGPKNSESGSVGHIFFVYCQTEELSPQNSFSFGSADRINFDAAKFASDRRIANLVAALYFRVTAAGQLMNTTSYSMAPIGGMCPNPK